MIQKISLTAVMLLFFASIVAADTIYLYDNSRIDCTVIRVTDKTIEYNPEGEKPFSVIKKFKVHRIVYEDGRTVKMHRAQRAAVKKVRKKKKTVYSYPVIGVTSGTPTILNLKAGWYFRYVGLTVSGMFYGPGFHYGAQGSILFMIMHTRRTIHGIALNGGYLYFGPMEGEPEMDWSYGGISYVFNFYGFHLELGISGGTGDFRNPQFIGQIGYLHRFNWR